MDNALISGHVYTEYSPRCATASKKVRKLLSEIVWLSAPFVQAFLVLQAGSGAGYNPVPFDQEPLIDWTARNKLTGNRRN